MTTLILASAIALSAVTAAADTSPFFVFDNGLRGANLTSIESQLDLVRDIGFAGLSWRTDPPERVRQVLAGARQRGLKVFVIYCNLDLKDGRLAYDPRLREIIAIAKGSGAMLWPNITSRQFKPSSPDGDPVAVAGLRELAGLCEAAGLRIAIYPHVGMWVHRVEDALRVVKKVDRKNVGLTFNLCHALLDGAEARIPALIREAAPYMFVATINGADRGASRQQIERVIQPLDKGTFDVGGVLKELRAAGFRGPIGLQCYKIQGEPREMLTRAMGAWRRYTAGQD